jgi:hypothetical protein
MNSRSFPVNVSFYLLSSGIHLGQHGSVLGYDNISP